MNKAVFLDRDGTINKSVDYMPDPNLFEMKEGVPEGVRILNKGGFLVIVASNQSGIHRGFFTEETLGKIHERMLKEFSDKNARIDDIYYCVCLPEENWPCRKPKPGMLLQASKEHNIDLTKSYMIGDKWSDVLAGQNAGCKSILVPEKDVFNETMKEMKEKDVKADFVAENFLSAVDWIIKDSS
jgi:D,D-heptose 1,7-bisphosphate phosphatase